jgi:uncharacterized membrane protein YjjP (DUF1212 family)
MHDETQIKELETKLKRIDRKFNIYLFMFLAIVFSIAGLYEHVN